MSQTKMLIWLTFGLAISLLILVQPGTTMANGASEGTKVKIDRYQVGLIFEEQVKAGDNSLHVQILDEKGLPVKGARVKISAMPVKDTQSHKNLDSDAHTIEGIEGMSHSTATALVHDMSSMGDLKATPTQVLSNEQFRKAGNYFKIVTFLSAGHWMLTTHFSINGQALSADFPVNIVASHSASFGILAGLVDLNALILWTASATRRNLVSA